jgi:prostaglandin-endoperoxide synthase 2
MNEQRNTSRDGLANQIETYVLTNFKWFWDLVQKHNWLKQKINKFLINRAIYRIPTRPYAVSTMHGSEYTSWNSLTDRTYTGRHLPPVATESEKLPDVDELSKLFLRREEKLSTKSTVLFSYFAQWFTDGFLRTDRTNYFKNTSNHEIDLSPLYGLNRKITDILRTHEGGKLKSQTIDGEEYPPYYYSQDPEATTDEDLSVKDEFKQLPPPYPKDWPDLDEEIKKKLPYLPPQQKQKLFAMGVERANSQIGYVMLNTLFLREHNRLCDLLARSYKNWDDERLFQTARNIVIVLLVKIVIEEYVNHITPYHFKFIAEPQSFTKEKWYRQNWMTVEFNLLYRWHSLVPDRVILDGREVAMAKTLWNTETVTSRGLGNLFENASSHPAGAIGLFNTPLFLLETDISSIKLGRNVRLASYNDYRELCQFPRVTDFDQITKNQTAQELLKHLYGDVDRIELYVGLFAEDTRENSPLSPLIGRLVGVDALSQTLTNPLLSEHVFNEQTFSPLGFEIIKRTHSLSDILHRNIPQSDRTFKVSLTQT